MPISVPGPSGAHRTGTQPVHTPTTVTPRPATPTRCATIAGLCCLAMIGATSHAQPGSAPQGAARAAATAAAAASAPAGTPRSSPTAARPPGAAASAPQQVEVRGQGAGDPNAERRRSTASRIVYGREEIDRMGDSTLGEVLKRLPGVTIGGPPGRGGTIRMRGMGGGYTMIMIDGQRMPFGFSLDSIAPEQIERIEIMRAPVAEHSARAIAGIINVVMREDFKRAANDLKIGGGAEGPRGQGGANWIYSGQTEALGYNLTATVLDQRLGQQSTSRVRSVDGQGQPTLEQLSTSTGQDHRQALFMNGRLQWRLGPGHNLELMPFLSSTRTRSRSAGTLQQPLNTGAGDTDAAYDHSATAGEVHTRMARLNAVWLRPTDSGGRLQMRLGTMQARNERVTRRHEFDDADDLILDRHEDGGARDRSIDFNGKFSQLLAESHSFSTGWELQRGQREDRLRTLVNGAPVLTEFGDNLEASTLRLAAFAQDEWEWSKTFSFYLGARWEGIETRGDTAEGSVRNRSSVLTPLAHMVWKLPDAPRDQLRLSLTRSYRAPNTSQLIARPTISTLYPDTSGPNQPTSPDRAGNAALKPELAWGLDLALEHYLDAGGIVSANVFLRRIDNLIRTVIAQEAVSWAGVPRWVARPQNIEGVLSAGLELEARVRASDLWATELPLTLRANASIYRSRVDGVPGPDNRLDQQPTYTLNAGFDWPLRGTPLTVGGNFNFTPAYVVQQIDSQVYRQGLKRVIDAYALWRLSPAASLRLNIANAGARDYETGATTVLPDGAGEQRRDTVTRTYTTASLRAELRF